MTKKKDNITRRPKGHVLQKTLELAARPEGVTNAELRDLFCFKHSDTGARLGNFCRSGYLFISAVPGLKNHYFTTAEAAEAWKKVAARPVAKLTSIGEKVREVRKIGRGPGILLEGSTPYVKRAQAVPAGVLLKKGRALAGEVTLHAEFKHSVTLMPEYDVRFQIDPATRVVGGFATLGIGRYIA